MRRCAGFTLLEVLVALTVLSFGVWYALQSLRSTSALEERAGHLAQAVVIAQSRLASDEARQIGRHRLREGGYNAELLVTPYRAEGIFLSGLVHASVKVSWPEAGSRRDYHLTRVLFRAL